MPQASAETLVQIMLWMTVLTGLVIIGVLVVQRFRGGAADKGTSANQLLANFEEMQSRGDISDADYRKIKSVLRAELHSGLKDDKNKG